MERVGATFTVALDLKNEMDRGEPCPYVIEI